MGLGGLGGQAQMLFGGSGGQDLFQKITWGLAVVFMASSMGLALLKTKSQESSQYLSKNTMAMAPITEPSLPQNNPVA